MSEVVKSLHGGMLKKTRQVRHVITESSQSALLQSMYSSCCSPRIRELLLAGCELEAEDHMGLAAMLKWGQGPLQRLDLSHNALSGVSAQCLLRQVNALQAAPPQKQAEAASGIEAGIQALMHLGGNSADGCDACTLCRLCS